jgi:hypothetical protein
LRLPSNAISIFNLTGKGFDAATCTNNAVTTGNPTNPFTGGNSTLRYLQSGTTIQRNRDILGPTGLPLYLIPGTNDKSIYDWSSINAVSPNNGVDKAETYSAEIEQVVLSFPVRLPFGEAFVVWISGVGEVGPVGHHDLR